MTLAPLLLEVLVCPDDRGPLWYFDDEQVLYNPRKRCKYLVRDGIPVLLVDEAVAVDMDDHRRYSEAAQKGDVPETGQGRAAGVAHKPLEPGSTEAGTAGDSPDDSPAPAEGPAAGGAEGPGNAAGVSPRPAGDVAPTVTGADDPSADSGGAAETRTDGDRRG